MNSSALRPKTVCVQGLGFVGAANAVAIASAKNTAGQPLYRVVGIEQETAAGRLRAAALSEGHFPFATNDRDLVEAARAANAAGSLVATTDRHAFSEADIIIVDVGLDLAEGSEQPHFRLAPFLAAISDVGENMPADALILLESTVGPGTCEQIVAPLLREHLDKRALPSGGLKLAYSYERVTPGDQYLSSTTQMWRVYAGITPEAAQAAESFLASVVSPQYPLRRLENIRSAELAKIVENSFRAVNIAFIDEWERFGRRLGVDMFEVLEAIRMRPSHQNIRYPGLGVGGYCLSKDPLFGAASASDIYGFAECDFPLSTHAVAINYRMPCVSVRFLEELLGGSLSKKRILVLGASYRPDIGDTRNSPSIRFVTALLERGAIAAVVDPLADELPGSRTPLHGSMPAPDGWDVIALAVPHRQFECLDLCGWAGDRRPLVFDVNGVLSRRALERLKQSGFPVAAIGRGSF